MSASGGLQYSAYFCIEIIHLFWDQNGPFTGQKGPITGAKGCCPLWADTIVGAAPLGGPPNTQTNPNSQRAAEGGGPYI